MRTALFLAWLGLLFLAPLHAEDWTTNDGKVYKNVRVVSQTPAFVTIMHDDGGGQIPLGNLKPDLQQRFNYTPAAAAKYLADTAAAVKANKEALAKEKARVAAQQAAQQEAAAEALFIALFTIPPDRDVPPDNTVASASDDSVPPPDVSAPTTPIASEPPTEIDDWGYGNYGAYGYGGYGYGYPSYRYSYGGYRGYHGGWSGHHGTHTFTNPSNVQVYPKH